MDDEVLVRIMHHAADRLEQLQPLVDGQAVRIAVAVEGLAFDVFHDHIWLAVFDG